MTRTLRVLIAVVLAGAPEAGAMVRAVRVQAGAGVRLAPAAAARTASAAGLALPAPSLPAPSLRSAFSPKTQSLLAPRGGEHSVGATGVHQGGAAPLIQESLRAPGARLAKPRLRESGARQKRRSTNGPARTAKSVLKDMRTLAAGLTRVSTERASARTARLWDQAAARRGSGVDVPAAGPARRLFAGLRASGGSPEAGKPAGTPAPAPVKEGPKARGWVKTALIGAGAAAGVAGLFAGAKLLLASAGMEDVSGLSAGAIGISFLAGLLSFLSPCTLPLIPAYISMIAGTALKQDADAAAQRKASRKAGLGSIAFVAGFSLVFTALGASATTIGAFLFDYLPIITKAAGGVVAVLGLHLLLSSFGKHIPVLSSLLYREKRFHRSNANGTLLGAFLMGLAFAFGWTPCIGPILGGILSMAAMEETVLEGIVLLAAYSLGLGLPFIATGFAVNRFNAFFQRYKRFIGWGERAAAAVLILLGVLIATDQLGWLLSLL